MTLTAIIILIVLGILLLMVEALLIPGVTIAGIGGFILMAAGIFFTYKYHGNTTGHIVLLSSGAATLIALIFFLRGKTWEKMGLTTNIESKIETFEKEKIKVGDEGKAITRLAPIGKAMVNDIICEAKSYSDFIDENTEITVIKINNNQIVVKPKTIS